MSETMVDERVDQLLAEGDLTDRVAFLGRQYDLGLAWVHFREGSGGLGLSPSYQRQIHKRLRTAGAPRTLDDSVIGLGMGAPTVATHGSDAQRERYLRPLFTGEEIWCQLFSEPGHGSDVAGLATRAERDGDEWIVNGQKVWTSVGHLARWGMLVARTDTDAPKHRGLTYFVIDMDQPGVETRPLRQMTGAAEFNEVFFTDARVPDAERLGDVGQGWGVALTTLMNERVAIGGSEGGALGGAMAMVLSAWTDGARHPGHRDELLKLYVRDRVNKLTNRRAGAARKAGNPGAEGSISKLAMAEFNKDAMAFCMNLMGPSGTLYGDYDRPNQWTDPAGFFLRVRANSIEGGTSEIMRNILGERELGLPGDVRVDKDVPWSTVPRN